MIFQKYENINDVESEFIPFLEELIADNVPSFDFLVNSEERSQNECVYFLLFGDKDNAPKGFIKGTLKEKKSLFFSQKKFIKWTGPNERAFVIEPKFKEEFKRSFSKIKENTHKDFQPSNHFLRSNDLLFQDSKVISEHQYVGTLFKSHTDYEQYLSSLSTSFKKRVKSIFNDYKTLNIKQYDSLKDCFSYKAHSSEEYKALKKDPLFKSVMNHDYIVSSLETSERVLAFTLIIKGKNKHSFFIFKNLSGLIDELLLIHMTILLFYEQSDLYYLHPLKVTDQSKDYEDSNFSNNQELECKI